MAGAQSTIKTSDQQPIAFTESIHAMKFKKLFLGFVLFTIFSVDYLSSEIKQLMSSIDSSNLLQNTNSIHGDRYLQLLARWIKRFVDRIYRTFQRSRQVHAWLHCYYNRLCHSGQYRRGHNSKSIQWQNLLGTDFLRVGTSSWIPSGQAL